MPERRADDRLTVPMFIAGIACWAFAGVLALVTKLVPLVMVFAVLGGLCMPTHRFVNAIRFWRRVPP